MRSSQAFWAADSEGGTVLPPRIWALRVGPRGVSVQSRRGPWRHPRVQGRLHTLRILLKDALPALPEVLFERVLPGLELSHGGHEIYPHCLYAKSMQRTFFSEPVNCVSSSSPARTGSALLSGISLRSSAVAWCASLGRLAAGGAACAGASVANVFACEVVLSDVLLFGGGRVGSADRVGAGAAGAYAVYDAGSVYRLA